MIWIDFTLMGIVFVFCVLGLLRGFNKEVFSLLFWLLASWVALTFNSRFSYFFDGMSHQLILKTGLSFVALFVTTLSLGGLIGFLINLLTKKSGVSILSRLGGMVLGTVRGMVFITAIVILVGLTPMPKESWWTKSMVLPPFQLLAVWLRDHVSSGMAEYIKYR